MIGRNNKVYSALLYLPATNFVAKERLQTDKELELSRKLTGIVNRSSFWDISLKAEIALNSFS